MKDLYGMKNTVVHLKSEEEYEEYMEMCESVNWKWASGDRANQYDAFNLSNYRNYKNLTCVQIHDRMEYSGLNYFKRNNYKILTLDELKEILKDEDDWKEGDILVSSNYLVQCKIFKIFEFNGETRVILIDEYGNDDFKELDGEIYYKKELIENGWKLKPIKKVITKQEIANSLGIDVDSFVIED